MITPLAFKIATQLLQEQLSAGATTPEAVEPADISPIPQQGASVLTLLGKNPRPTATAAAPKVLTGTGQIPQGS